MISRYCAIAVLTLSLVLGLSSLPHDREAHAAGKCQGENLISALQKNDPEAYTRLVEEADAIENGQGLVWKVTSSEGAVSFLAGTMHVGPDLVPDLPSALERVWPKVDRVALELKEVADPTAMATVSLQYLSLLLLPEGLSIKDYLSAGELLTLEQLARDRGEAVNFLHRFQPSFVAATLTTPKCQRPEVAYKLKKALSDAVDARIGHRVLKDGGEVLGLETAEEQFRSLVEMDLPDQVVLLRQALSLGQNLDDISITTAALYQEETIGLLWAWSNAMADETGTRAVMDVFYAGLLDRRNVRMVERAKPLLEKGRTLIAVGALHLPGEKGLVTLLRNAGYQVKRLQ